MTQDVLERAQPQSVVGPGALAAPAETIAALRGQIGDFLDYATDAALQPLLDTDLPFVGDALKNVLTDALLDPVKSAIDDALAMRVSGAPPALGSAAMVCGGASSAPVSAGSPNGRSSPVRSINASPAPASCSCSARAQCSCSRPSGSPSSCQIL